MKIISWNIYIPHDKSKEVEFDIIHGETTISWIGYPDLEDGGEIYEGKISFDSFMKNNYFKNKQFQFLIDNSTKTLVDSSKSFPNLHYCMHTVKSNVCWDDDHNMYTCYEFGVLGMGWNESMIKFMSNKIQYIKNKIMKSEN